MILNLYLKNKQLKRFSESFFTKDIPRIYIQDYESSDNYVLLYDIIRQSAYFQQMPDMLLCCDDLDGLPDNMPIIFEENYVPTVTMATPTTTAPIPFASFHASTKKNSPRSNFIMSLLNNNNNNSNNNTSHHHNNSSPSTGNSKPQYNSSGDGWPSATKKSNSKNDSYYRKSSQSSSAETSSASSVSNNAQSDVLTHSQVLLPGFNIYGYK